MADLHANSYPNIKKMLIVLSYFKFRKYSKKELKRRRIQQAAIYNQNREEINQLTAAVAIAEKKQLSPTERQRREKEMNDRFNELGYSEKIEVKKVPLDGNTVTVQQVKETFKLLNFDVISCTDQTVEETLAFLDMQVKSIIENRYDCMVMYISSHGKQGYILCDDNYLKLSTIIDKFNISMVGQPKIFIVDTCQGGSIDLGIPVVAQSSTAKYQHEASYSHCAVAMASYEGYKSYTSSKTGSFYGQALVYVLKKYPKHEFAFIMMKVNKAVSEKILDVSLNQSISLYAWQQPYYKSSLRKEFYFETPLYTYESAHQRIDLLEYKYKEQVKINQLKTAYFISTINQHNAKCESLQDKVIQQNIEIKTLKNENFEMLRKNHQIVQQYNLVATAKETIQKELDDSKQKISQNKQIGSNNNNSQLHSFYQKQQLPQANLNNANSTIVI